MAEDESILTNPPTQDVAIHVRDYTRFTKLLKYGALIFESGRLIQQRRSPKFVKRRKSVE